MELWIRSQDRECLMKINRIDYDYSLGEHKIWVNGYQTLVGKYKTQEKTLEVLDEIQDLINDIADNKMVGCIYEMPKD